MTLLGVLFSFHSPLASADEVLFQDDFSRNESDESKEQVGNGWRTNSRGRAQGNKQVDLADGALHIYRHKVADHGVSVVQDIAFTNATIAMRFKIGKGDELGINIADLKEKSVHAGHLCVTKIRPGKVMIVDLKTGRMQLDRRGRNKAKQLTTEDKRIIKSKEKSFPVKLSTDAWHDLKIQISGDTLTVMIDAATIGSFTSEGIAHPTKRQLRLAVAKNAWVDDIVVTKPNPS
ncbi:MAG: hypothetical protein AAF745_19585 [Planctomycetota bacterium]